MAGVYPGFAPSSQLRQRLLVSMIIGRLQQVRILLANDLHAR